MSQDEQTLRSARQWTESLKQGWSAVPADNPEPPDEGTREFILATLQNATGGTDRSVDSEAAHYLERLAHHFSGEDVRFREPSQIREFCERLRRSVTLLVEEFQTLLAGRKKIQNDWSLYSSAAAIGDQALMTRDIRLGDIHGDLGQVLFDWRHPGATDEAIGGLKQSLEELKHHQMATMAGYERSVAEGARSLLDRLDPQSVEREFLGGSDEKQSVARKRWKRFIPFRGQFMWRLYRNRFDQITSEDSRWYQRQFLPAFRQGYRDYMASRLAEAKKDAAA